MDRFQFRITLGTEDEWRRIKDRLGRDLGGSSLSGRLRGDGAEIAGIHIPLAIVFLCGALLAGTILEAPGTLVNGVTVQGSHILVVEDTSRSMGSSTDELIRQRLLLGSALFEGSPKISGFGVISTGDESNLLHVLQRELPARRGVDTLYIFSDFQPVTPIWDCNDPPGLMQYRQLIRSAGVRLYLSTVKMLPSAGLLAIARESGGGLVGLAGAAESLQARREICHIDD